MGIGCETQVRINRFDYGITLEYARSLSKYQPVRVSTMAGPEFEDVCASLFVQIPFKLQEGIELLSAIGGTGKWIRTRYSARMSYESDNEDSDVLENLGTGGGFYRIGIGLKWKKVVFILFGKLFVDVGSIFAKRSSPLYPSIGLAIGLNPTSHK
jgi:hypothetical protein